MRLPRYASKLIFWALVEYMEEIGSEEDSVFERSLAMVNVLLL